MLRRSYSEYISALSRNFTYETFVDIEENVTIKQVQRFKCPGFSLNKKGINLEDIVSKIFKEKQKQKIGCLNSLW